MVSAECSHPVTLQALLPKARGGELPATAGLPAAARARPWVPPPRQGAASGRAAAPPWGWALRASQGAAHLGHA